MPAGVGGGFNHHLIGTKANNRASISFVTGAHNMKFGYQGGFSNPSQTYQYFNEVNFVRLRDAVPNQLRQVITVDDSDARIKVVRNLWPTSFYAQDQWTNNRLTLQGGIRYDWYLANYPESKLGGPGYTASIPNEIVYPSRSTQGISWQDVTPRMGVAYDLFGDGKTALKFNLGKYMQANSAANNDLDLNPIIRTAISTTRVWTDTNKDFVANCVLTNPEKNGECAAMDNKNLGKEVFDRTYDTSFTEAWGSRMYNWGLGVSVQQEVAPRVSVNVGYYRNWWGNWYTVDNRAEPAVGLDAVQHHGAGRSAAAWRRRPGDPRPVQSRSGCGRRRRRVGDQFQELRGAERKLARRGCRRQRAAAERPHVTGRHEHRAPAFGCVRAESGAAGAGHRARAVTPRRSPAARR